MIPARMGNFDERSCCNSGPPMAQPQNDVRRPSKYTCIYIFIRLILVRSMRRAMVSMILVLSGCVTPPTQITGRYATRLSNSDLQQIKRLVAGDPKLDH